MGEINQQIYRKLESKKMNWLGHSIGKYITKCFYPVQKMHEHEKKPKPFFKFDAHILHSPLSANITSGATEWCCSSTTNLDCRRFEFFSYVHQITFNNCHLLICPRFHDVDATFYALIIIIVMSFIVHLQFVQRYFFFLPSSPNHHQNKLDPSISNSGDVA